MHEAWQYPTILVTGGTGTFGKAFLDAFSAQNPTHAKLRILSRDEFKQAELLQRYRDIPHVSFMLGDVRSLERLRIAFRGVDCVIHAAALKHVPIGEYNPFEVVETNILGTQNIIKACLESGVQQAILLSSDKAVEPINLYGSTKMTAEKLFVQANNYSHSVMHDTRFAVVRYGNVMGSRGSVTDVFQCALDAGNPLPLTSPDMTRFALTIEEAVQLVIEIARKELRGGIVVPNLPAFGMNDFAIAFLMAHNRPHDIPIVPTGIRPGEKMHERLMTQEEGQRAWESFDARWFFIPPLIRNWAEDIQDSWQIEQIEPGDIHAHFVQNYQSGTWPWRLGVSELVTLIEGLL